MGEFELIRQFFTRPSAPSGNVVLGIGDDCALLRPTPETLTAISSDMLVQGRHFFPNVDSYTLGHKALAVNLSDLAACGAKPVAFTLALALPEANPTWLQAFAHGLFALADAHQCSLVGGDTTRGPVLTICITVFGEVPCVQGRSQALRRSTAHVGDDIYVSGTLGDASLALQALQGQLALPDALLAPARKRLEQPDARVALGMALRGIAHAAADVSDGLLGDLGHILHQSHVGATLWADRAITLLAARAATQAEQTSCGFQLTEALALRCVLSGGDDYELVFTAAPTQRAAIHAAALQSHTPVTRIGTIEPQPGLRLVDAQGLCIPIPEAWQSFDHFATA